MTGGGIVETEGTVVAREGVTAEGGKIPEGGARFVGATCKSKVSWRFLMKKSSFLILQERIQID